MYIRKKNKSDSIGVQIIQIVIATAVSFAVEITKKQSPSHLLAKKH
jgi:hypothetical protein